MEFEMNGRKWKIIELSQEEIQEKIKRYDMVDNLEDGRYFGSTQEAIQTIYLDTDLCEGQKRQTLLHELMHCYLSCYLFQLNNVEAEALCNISACSHDIIHKIVADYFK